MASSCFWLLSFNSCLFALISSICAASSPFSRLMLANPRSTSASFACTCSRFRVYVFIRMFIFWISVFNSSRIPFCFSRSSVRNVICFLCSSSFTESFSICSSISSSSRFRPSRFDVFLNAPPVIDPPGLKYSPSNVTICKL